MYVAAAAMFLQKGTHNNTYRKEAELESSQGSLGAGGDGEKEHRKQRWLTRNIDRKGVVKRKKWKEWG